MEEFRDGAELAESIRARIGVGDALLVGIDGAYYSGKSTVAEALAGQLSLTHIRVDHYSEGKGGPYVDQLRYDALRRDLEQARSQGRSVIVDGVCLLAVLDRLGLSLNILVYAKKLDETGYWPDEDTCDPAVIDLESHLLRQPGAGLARDVARYHLQHDPHRKADYVFVRVA